MKHALFLAVIFLAGCPDDKPQGPPPTYDPHDTCIGFGLAFGAQTYADSSYFSYSASWSGAYGSDVKPIALGGIEYIAVTGTPYIDQTTPEFTSAVTGPTLAIDDTYTSINYAGVIGAEPGSADLCIYDRGSTELHDGTRVTVRPVTSMFAVPSGLYYQNYERQPTGTVYPFSHWSMFIGAKRRIGVALVGDRNWRLIDQGMKIETALDDEPFSTPTPEGWDDLSREVAHAGTLHVRATLRSGEVWNDNVTFTDRVDQIALQPPYTDLQHLRVTGGYTTLCFTSTTDGAQVFAAPYAFAATDTVVLHPQSMPPNCISFEPIESGEGSLTATVRDKVLTVPFNVDP